MADNTDALCNPDEQSLTPDLTLEAQKQLWNREQLDVASAVKVLPDPPRDTRTTELFGDPPLFHVVQSSIEDNTSTDQSNYLFGGVDISFPLAPSGNEGVEMTASSDGTNPDKAVAVYVVVDQRNMQVVYSDHEYYVLDMPYIPTYLAFREIDPIQRLIEKQMRDLPEMTPRAILVDGNGILHPRHAGIACFVGTRTGIPTIGIGKSLFYEGGWTREALDHSLDTFLTNLSDTLLSPSSPNSTAELVTELRRQPAILYQTIPDDPTSMTIDTSTSGASPKAPKVDRKELLEALAPCTNGIALPLLDRSPASKENEDTSTTKRFPILGCALAGHGGRMMATTSSRSSKPIFVSVGHNLSLIDAVTITANLSQARIPEPVRQADLQGRELMRQQQQQQSSSS